MLNILYRNIYLYDNKYFYKNYIKIYNYSYITIQYNKKLIKMVMLRCTIFWYKYVYNKLK